MACIVEKLNKFFGSKHVLKDINLRVKKGEINVTGNWCRQDYPY